MSKRIEIEKIFVSSKNLDLDRVETSKTLCATYISSSNHTVVAIQEIIVWAMDIEKIPLNLLLQNTYPYKRSKCETWSHKRMSSMFFSLRDSAYWFIFAFSSCPTIGVEPLVLQIDFTHTNIYISTKSRPKKFKNIAIIRLSLFSKKWSGMMVGER